MRLLIVLSILALVALQLSQAQEQQRQRQTVSNQRQLTPQERYRQMVLLQRRRLAAQQKQILAAKQKQAAAQAAANVQATENLSNSKKQTTSQAAANAQSTSIRLTNSKKTPVSLAGQAPQKKKNTISKPFDGEIQEIPLNTRITDINDADFNAFLKDEKAVRILVSCFLQLDKCRYNSIRNLLLQVRTLGVGARCETCTEKEQEDLNNKLYRFIYVFQTKYRSYWRQILPHLGFILGTNNKRPS